MKRFASAAFLISATSLALAQSPGLTPDQIIAARQAGMDLTQGNVNAMKVARQTGADPKPFEMGAAGIVAWAKAYPALFPEDTKTGHDTKAKPEVWSDNAGFQTAASNLVSAAEKLLAAAKADDKAAFATEFDAVGETCGGCHRKYKNR